MGDYDDALIVGMLVVVVIILRETTEAAALKQPFLNVFFCLMVPPTDAYDRQPEWRMEQ